MTSQSYVFHIHMIFLSYEPKEPVTFPLTNSYKIWHNNVKGF
jgi:hypothetical protein